VAGGVGLLVVILLFVGIRGCLGSRKDQAFKDYAADVNSLVANSNAIDKALFQALSTPKSADTLDVQTEVNSKRVDAEQLVKRAQDTDHPGELARANEWLVETLEFRSESISKIADALPQALGTKDRAPAINQIAAEMQGLVASDVIYQTRVIPDLQSAFEERGIEREFLKSEALPTLQWLDPKYVQTQLDKVSGDETEADTSGLHGTGIGAASVGDTELTEGEVNRVAAAGAVTFEVQVENQGDGDETAIDVAVTVTSGSQKIEASGTIPQIAAGETATVSIPLGKAPPTDGVSTVEISVAPVPGEGTKDNNEASYEVAFTK
jgi:hypothetical protein